MNPRQAADLLLHGAAAVLPFDRPAVHDALIRLRTAENAACVDALLANLYHPRGFPCVAVPPETT